MNPDHVKGSINEVKGKVKENIGHAAGAEQLEGEGIVDRVKGKVQTAIGDLKDAAKEGIDSLLDKTGKKH